VCRSLCPNITHELLLVCARLQSKSTLLPFLDGFSQDIPHEANSVKALTKQINENPADGTLYLRRARASFATEKFDDVFDDAQRAADKLRGNESAKQVRPCGPLLSSA
jgi:hypothetical protein